MSSNQNDPFPNVLTPTATLTAGLVVTTPTLTDLKLISAMCLQGILSYPFRQNEPYENTFERVSSAIEHAKELLKQLEAEND